MTETFSIGIDGLNLALNRGTGVATYARTLARSIAEMGRAPDLIFGLPIYRQAPVETRETLFFAEFGKDDPSDGGPGGKPPSPTKWFVSPMTRHLTEIPVTGRVHAEAFAGRLPKFTNLHSFGSLWSVAGRHFKRYGQFLHVQVQTPPKIMHWTYPVPIHLDGAINIYTIHDLVPLRLPHTSLENKHLHEKLLRACIRRAPKICTVSETSRQDIIQFLGARPEQVANCYQSIDTVPQIDKAEMTARLRALFDLQPQGYFLYFGAIEPKKNVGRLIEAYLASEVQTPLILVGGRAWRSEQELQLLGRADSQTLPGAARIRKLDYLPRRMLDVLIAGAKGVLFPSLYEGFGLPVVEALARGVPVMTSTAGSLPEIAGDAALFVDPYDTTAMAVAIKRLDGDAALRARLASAGPTQAGLFTTDLFKRRLADLYRPLIAPARRSATVPFVVQEDVLT